MRPHRKRYKKSMFRSNTSHTLQARFVLFALLFFCGVLVGELLGRHAPERLYRLELDAAVVSHGIWVALSLRLLFPVLALLFSHFSVGRFALPVVCIVRGLVFGSCAATLLHKETCGFGMVLILVGIPAVFSLPALLLQSDTGVQLSAAVRLGFRGVSRNRLQKRVWRSFLLSVSLVPLLLLYAAYLSPFLISLSL